jgi:hypothetical protein
MIIIEKKVASVLRFVEEEGAEKRVKRDYAAGRAGRIVSTIPFDPFRSVTVEGGRNPCSGKIATRWVLVLRRS